MNMILERDPNGDPVRDQGFFGTFLTEDDKPFCRTLERDFDGKPKIPVGTYTCELRHSPKFGYDVYMLVDVPGHDFIEIHIANWQTQLDGCIATGEDAKPPMLLSSKEAFDRFMALQAGAKSFTLLVK